ncbi:MAG: OB-fold domain-containing protein [Burkholderiales bacterium]
MSIADWTREGSGIAFQICRTCNSTWYFQRGFCPGCGAGEPDVRQASGNGTVHARSLVTRAPSEELRAYAPYLILLVDADEGFRLMAHGDPALQIGDRVRARFVDFGGRKIPYFDNF